MPYFLLIITASLWGGTVVCARSLSDFNHPSLSALMRFVFAIMFLSIVVLVKYRKRLKMRRATFLKVAGMGVTGVYTYNLCFFSGLELISASRGALIIALNPIFTASISAIIFKEPYNFRKFIGTIIAALGAWIVITEGNLSSILENGVGRGELLLFGCVISWVISTLLARSINKEIPSVVILTGKVFCGTLLLFATCLIQGEVSISTLSKASMGEWINFVYLGVFGTGIAALLYYYCIPIVGAGNASLCINFVPVSAVILSYFILDERLGLYTLLGGVLIVSGAILATRVKTRVKTTI